MFGTEILAEVPFGDDTELTSLTPCFPKWPECGFNPWAPPAVVDYLPGNPPMYGVKQELPPHYQGEDIIIPVTLARNGCPVNQVDYKLAAVMKDDLNAANIIWRGAEKFGIDIVGGNVFVHINREASKCIPSGTYYLAVLGASPMNVKSCSLLFHTMLRVTPSAASPYPIGGVPPHFKPLPSIPINWFYLPISYFE